MVCHARSMIGVEKKIGAKILKYSACLAMGMGLATVLYKDSMRMYLDCMGKNERFIFDMGNMFVPTVGGAGIRLGFFNPFRLSVNFVMYAFVFLVPCLYFRIFQFRQTQDRKVTGKIDNRL